ncbi:hypothetical protein MMC22_002494 [Lobaria immixta]|nr:hypothetical protein [Lobaria immixta]
MCNGSFREGLKHHIELPDDDIHVFGYMLEYLYRGVFRGFETPNQDLKTVMLADLYIMAEKYQLQGLKTLLVTPLEALFDCPGKAEGIVCFFDAARKIYENIPDSEALFPDCFKKTVMYIVRFRDEQPYIEEQIKLCISDGGKLARDAFDAYSMQIHNEHKIHDSGVKRKSAALGVQLYTLSRDLMAKKDALELKVCVLSATNSSITGYHGIHHGDCKMCC